MGDLERLEHRLLVDLLGARLDHRDRVRRAGDDQVELGLLGLLAAVGLMMNSPPIRPIAHGADRAANGMSEIISAAEAPMMHEDVGVVHLVGRQDGATTCVSLR